MWKLLRNASAWESFQAEVEAAFAVAGELRWDSVPEEFPCLVDVVRPKIELPDGRVVVGDVATAFVYPRHAYALLQAAGPMVSDCGTSSEIRLPRPDDPPSSEPVDRTEWFRSINAHVITLLREVFRVGIIDRDQYAQNYAANLALVDQWSAEDRDDYLRGRVRCP